VYEEALEPLLMEFADGYRASGVQNAWWRLPGDGFWEVLSDSGETVRAAGQRAGANPPGISELRSQIGGIPERFEEALREVPALRSTAASALVDRFFADRTSAETRSLLELANGSATTDPSQDDIHLVVKWTPKFGANSDDRHIEIAQSRGAVWWGLFTQAEEPQRLAEKWYEQLHAQIDLGRDSSVFVVGQFGDATCWRARLLDLQYDRANIDEGLVPSYYRAEWRYHLWVKITDFEPIDRDNLYRILDPAMKPGRPVALSNQSNPLIVRIRSSPRTWWVNQGDSYRRAREGGYIWAPLVNKKGSTQRYWETLKHVRPRDIVLNYAKTEIRYWSEALSDAQPSPRPDPDADQAWNDEGRRINLRYHDLGPRIPLEDIPIEWRQAEEGGPFRKDGAVNEGYLFPLSDNFAAKLKTRFPQLDDAWLEVDDGEGEPEVAFDLAALEQAVLTKRLRIDSEVLANVLAALKSGKHVILTGPPGTAKTTLAEVVATLAGRAGLCTGYTLTTATADWTTYETIGGLKPDRSGELTFQEGHFLEAIRRRQWLLIDELNRSNFDRAFGQLFTVLSRQAVELPYERTPGRGRLALVPHDVEPKSTDVEVLRIPADWRVIATMNVFDKSLLFEMSFALMRRFAFVEVPSPPIEDFEALINEQTEGDVEAAALALRFLQLRTLKDLGPAVFMDLARYVAARKQLTDVSDTQLSFEAFYSYLLPQFEGIDEVAGERLYKEVRKLVGSTNSDRLRQTLRSVLGLDLSSHDHGTTSSEEPLDTLEDDLDVGQLDSD
jgi:MoxR-like ATPase